MKVWIGLGLVLGGLLAGSAYSQDIKTIPFESAMQIAFQMGATTQQQVAGRMAEMQKEIDRLKTDLTRCVGAIPAEPKQ